MNPLTAPQRIGFVVTLTVATAWAALGCGSSSASSDAGGVVAEPPVTRPDDAAGRPARSPTLPTAPPDLARNRERESSTQVLAYPTGERETSVILLEKRFPTQARLGQNYRYELKVTNLTDWPISGVVVREEFPASFAVAAEAGAGPGPAVSQPATSPSTRPASAAADAIVGIDDVADRGAGTDGAGPATSPTDPPVLRPAAPREGPDVRYVQGVGYVRDVAGTWWGTATRKERRGTIAREFLVGTLEAKQARTIPVAGVSDEIGSLDTRTTVTYTPVLAGGTDVINPILKLTKEGPRHADLCDAIDYRYVVSNVGVGTETEVRIDEPLPDGLTTEDGKRAVAIAVGELPQQQQREFRVKVRAARTGEFTGKATARGFGTAAQSADVPTAVHAPKLTVAMTGPESEYVGKSAGYELTVTNVGDAAARNAAVTAGADGGAQVAFAASADAPAAFGPTQPVGVIEPGKSKKVRVTARPVAGGLMTVRATAKADCAEAVSAAAGTTVQTIAAVAMDVADRDDPVRVGEATVYRITVRNQGSGADRNVRVVATLPSQLAYAQSTGPTPGVVGGQRLTFEPLPRLDPGQSVTWTVEARAESPGDVRFRVDLTSETLTEPVVGTQPTRLY